MSVTNTTAQEKMDALIQDLRGNLLVHNRFWLSDRRLNAAIKETDAYESVDPKDMGRAAALSYDNLCEAMAAQLVDRLAGGKSLLFYPRNGRIDLEELRKLLREPHVIANDDDWIWILPASTVEAQLT